MGAKGITMSIIDQRTSDVEAIEEVMQTYIRGAISGRVEDLEPAFYEQATIHGYVGPDLFAGPIQGFYEWHTQNGPAAELQCRTVSIDIEGSIAMVRIELDNWTGHRFTDMFTLLRMDGAWKIISKVFHMHA
jgi:hypothetical protein